MQLSPTAVLRSGRSKPVRSGPLPSDDWRGDTSMTRSAAAAPATAGVHGAGAVAGTSAAGPAADVESPSGAPPW